MSDTATPTVRDLLSVLFPERHVHVRCGADSQNYRLTPGRQALIALLAAGFLVWINVSLIAALSAALRPSADALVVPKVAAAVSAGASAALAEQVERRHAALGMLLSVASQDPGAAQELQPAFPALAAGETAPAQRIAAVMQDQDRLVRAAGAFAERRAERLRNGLALIGIHSTLASPPGGALHGPIISAHNPRDLAVELRVDLDFARRVQNAAANLFDLRDLAETTDRLPLAHPVDSGNLSSGFGPRRDPINGVAHFHAGLDFPGPALSAIRATAPGVIVFTGPRGAYGNAVEIDHGGGFWTRYAHLSEIEVAVGRRVSRGERIGGMGSTGHSTGTHLHYEVWQNGRAQDPMRFLRAGDAAQRQG